MAQDFREGSGRTEDHAEKDEEHAEIQEDEENEKPGYSCAREDCRDLKRKTRSH